MTDGMTGSWCVIATELYVSIGSQETKQLCSVVNFEMLLYYMYNVQDDI